MGAASSRMTRSRQSTVSEAETAQSASRFDWDSDEGHDRIRQITRVVQAADSEYEKSGGGSRHWVRDHFIPTLEAAGLTIAPTPAVRPVTTPYDDPIVEACVRHGGHFWPADAPEHEPATCTRCWYNPGWKAGKPRSEAELRPVIDDPRGG